ncbi:E3 ubiquitin-protein ligase RMA1, partial [Bienertia sinuspersici]
WLIKDNIIVNAGSHEVQGSLDHVEICDHHEDCATRREQIKLTKGFVAKEPVKGHMASSSVNVVKGLKMYENIFTDQELSRLNDFVNELRTAGQKGELLGETYILFNKQNKANKREQIQLGVPIFGQIKDDTSQQQQKTNIEHIPELVHSVIDHLVQWQVLPENRRPNGCIIKYFDEGEYSQPFLKPPHLDQPLCTLVLSESTMAYGRTLVNDGEGNYRGQLMLSLKQGSLLVMRNNSADMARHVMCASQSKRVSITFSRVRPDSVQSHRSSPLSSCSPLPQAMTMWQPGMPNGDQTVDVVPKWGVIRAPIVMLAPMSPVAMNSKRNLPRGGTGVFLPWAVGSRKPAKHLPPRAQKGRFLSYAQVEEHNVSDTMSDPGVEGRV